MKKITIDDLSEATKNRIKETRNKTINNLFDEILFDFVIDWENTCNRINKGRKGLELC